MGKISKNTFKRIFLLYLISKFPKGCYGSSRLQKICFFASDQSDLKPFTFEHWHFGQYSFELPEILEQLISMNYVCAIPLESEGGNRYIALTKKLEQFYSDALIKISAKAKNAIDNSVKNHALKPWEDLKNFAYEYSGLNDKTKFNTILLKENLDDNIKLTELSDDDCEELELSLNPTFIACSLKIIEAVDSGQINLESFKEMNV